MVSFVLTSWRRQSQQQQQSDRKILDKIMRRTRTRTAAVPAITMRALGQVLSSQWEGSSQCAHADEQDRQSTKSSERISACARPSLSWAERNVRKLSVTHGSFF